MSPNLGHGQLVLASPLRPRSDGPLRGDVVVHRRPEQNHRVYIKRIVGLPGESISLRDGVTYSNDCRLEEPYLDNPQRRRAGNERECWLGPDEYFVMGDNRGLSEDSRVFGPVARYLIIGRVWFRYWPLSALGSIPGGSQQPASN